MLDKVGSYKGFIPASADAGWVLLLGIIPRRQAWLRILLGGKQGQDDRMRWSFCRT